MKILNDEKYNRILTAARNEFIKKGFKDASMRTIAKHAKIGLSNIYNYFKSKDDLFLAVVKPAKDELYHFIEQQHTEEHMDFNRMSTFSYMEDMIEPYIQIIFKYKAEFRLLLYRSEGSSLKNFRDSFADFLTHISNDYMIIVRKKYPKAGELSDFLIHVLSSLMVNILGEIVTHNLSKQKTREFFSEYFRFEIAGWRELVGV